jgi:hypothetical protein
MHLLWAQLNLPNKGTEPVWSRRGFRNESPAGRLCLGNPVLSSLLEHAIVEQPLEGI